MRFGSLFAGIGGLDLGLERAGMQCVWQVEIDPYAQRVLGKHWPTVRRWDDVRTFPPEPVADWGCDLIAGGFPCQDVSEAGKRAGIDGERSGLWSEFARVVRLLRPRYVLVENVPGLFARGFGRVLGDLAALGFNAEWEVLPAAAFGAPHIRERVFLLAYSQRDGLERLVEDRPAEKATERSGVDSLSDASGRRARQLRREQFEAFCEGTRNLHWPEVEPPVCGMVDGVPSRVDRLRTLGNAVVPAVGEWIGRRIIESVEDVA